MNTQPPFWRRSAASIDGFAKATSHPVVSMDVIEVQALRLRCVIGVSEAERRGLTDVVIDLDLGLPAPAGHDADRVADAWNYKPPVKAVIAHVEQSSYRTVEALAVAIARLLVLGHGAPFVRVRVHKPGALRFADSVGVVIERTATHFATGREAVDAVV
jgi:FolB domain-containing protein